jgi:hypothetical protein
MCLSRLREGRWIRVQKRTINEEVLTCVCPINEEGAHMCLSTVQVEGRTMDKGSEEDNQ